MSDSRGIRPRFLLLRVGVMSVSVYYFVLTIFHLIKMGAPLSASMICGVVWALFIAGVAAAR